MHKNILADIEERAKEVIFTHLHTHEFEAEARELLTREMGSDYHEIYAQILKHEVNKVVGSIMTQLVGE